MESDLREAREKALEAEMLQEEVALLKLELETAAETAGYVWHCRGDMITVTNICQC